MKNNQSIGTTIAALRKEKGATQEELAIAVGISPQAVSKWENGGSPDVEMLPAIADFFEIPIDKLFGRTSGATTLYEALRDYVNEPGQFKGFDRALKMFEAIQRGLAHWYVEGDFLPDHCVHDSDVNGYSLLVTGGYGNIVTRKFWEDINLGTLENSQKLFALLGQPGVMAVLFALLQRPWPGSPNFEMIKSALATAEYSHEVLQNALDSLVSGQIVETEESPYPEIGTTYCINYMYYLGLCSIICAVQVMRLNLKGISGHMGRGAWPINMKS